MPIVSGGSGFVPSTAQGFEIGYDQVTASVTVASTTEATGTTVITCAAHTFDGAAVLATFFTPEVLVGNQTDNIVAVSLFEGATQIGRLAQWQGPTTVAPNQQWPGIGMLRFTPTAASHTYTVTVFAASVAGTAPVLRAAASGTGTQVPMFIRFTKV